MALSFQNLVMETYVGRLFKVKHFFESRSPRTLWGARREISEPSRKTLQITRNFSGRRITLHQFGTRCTFQRSQLQHLPTAHFVQCPYFQGSMHTRSLNDSQNNFSRGKNYLKPTIFDRNTKHCTLSAGFPRCHHRRHHRRCRSHHRQHHHHLRHHRHHPATMPSSKSRSKPAC